MIHVALANRWYPPESGSGGVAMYNHTIARALCELGHRVTVVAARYDEVTPPVQERDGIRIVRLLMRDNYRWRRLPGLGPYVRPMQQFLYSLRVDRALRTLYAQDPFDIVEFAEVNAEGFCYLHRPLTPTVVRCHTPTFVLRDYYMADEMPFDTAWTIRMEQACIRRANALTAPSYDMARTIATRMGFPAERFTIIPNAVPDEFFSDRVRAPNRPIAQSPNRSMTILHVGRLERVKGIGVLAKAIPLVLKQVPQARFVFIGAARSDATAMQWRSRLEGAGGDKVVVLGFLEQSEMMSQYHQAHIAVVPSLNYESFSYTCAQAMAVGLPVIASRIGGIPETIEDGVSGILFEPGNPVELAKAIVALARHRELRQEMGQAGRRRAARQFRSLHVAEQILLIYSRTRRKNIV